MAAWELVPSLVRLREDLNTIAPNRDKRSDGSIGDRAHAAGGNSDHLPDEEFAALRDKDPDAKNEVHAIDADHDLNEPGLTMEMVVQHILSRCRAGAEKRLTYIIYNRRIWSASQGWRERRYAGSSPHTEHAHFSASYEHKREQDTSSWRLEDIPVALTAADKNWLVQQIDARADQIEANLIAKLAPGQVKITQNTATEIGKKAGDMVPLSTLLQLAVIYSARSDDKAATAVTAVAKLGEGAK